MTRRAWTVVIVVVAVIVAAVAGAALMKAAHHGREAVWPQARLSVQNGQADVQDGQSGQGWQGGGFGQNGAGNGQNGGGYQWGGDGSGPQMGGGAMRPGLMRPGDPMMARGGWQPLRGLPWLVLGLLVGAGVTVLVWRPWKRPALAAGAAGAAGAQGSAGQWAQRHRDLHAADEAATQPIATAVAGGPESPESAVETATGTETPDEPDSEA